MIGYLKSFEFLSAANIFKNVFDFIEPVSKTHQVHYIDIMAYYMLTKAEKNVILLRIDTKFKKIYNSTELFSEENMYNKELTVFNSSVRQPKRETSTL